MLDVLETRIDTPEEQTDGTDVVVLRELGAKPIQQLLAVNIDSLHSDTPESRPTMGPTQYATGGKGMTQIDFDWS